MEGQTIQNLLKLPEKINDGVKRHCRSRGYRVVNTPSGIQNFCDGIQIVNFSQCELVQSIPRRRHSEHLINDTSRTVQIQDWRRPTSERTNRVRQEVTVRVTPHQVGLTGGCNASTEGRESETNERNVQTGVPPCTRRENHEDYYIDVMRYRVTLMAQADRKLTVITARAFLGGGIGAAGGGVGGALAGAGAGATTGGLLGLAATPFGSVVGAAFGALIGAGIGFVGGSVGGAGAGVGAARAKGRLSLTCTAEDIFRNLELRESFHLERGRVIVEISGQFECPRSQTNTLMEEIESINRLSEMNRGAR